MSAIERVKASLADVRKLQAAHGSPDPKWVQATDDIAALVARVEKLERELAESEICLPSEISWLCAAVLRHVQGLEDSADWPEMERIASGLFRTDTALRDRVEKLEALLRRADDACYGENTSLGGLAWDIRAALKETP